jgi:hypothetical protein
VSAKSLSRSHHWYYRGGASAEFFETSTHPFGSTHQEKYFLCEKSELCGCAMGGLVSLRVIGGHMVYKFEAATVREPVPGGSARGGNCDRARAAPPPSTQEKNA